MGKKFYIETYGCQMNVADSEVVKAVLIANGYEYTENYEEADFIMLNTCTVRAKPEERIFGRLSVFKHLKKSRPEIKVGILGCMAQRMKHQLLEKEAIIDFVAGPDTYKRLPQIIERSFKERVVDVKLSTTETYDEILPYRTDKSHITAFVSISRGCDNMCTFCIVPFTRGRERSRNPESILKEIADLHSKGYKEITLLGQNVDKYNWNNKVSFADLLSMVAEAFPDMRIRFATSYPKDFSDEVIYTIAKYPNVCNYIHLPVQSGSDRILEKMKRGYTKQWYLDRIKKIREVLPDAAITTDIIAGFCSETEEDHRQTLELMQQVRFDYAYMFKYSERPNTYAARFYKDDVPEEVKLRRLNEIIELQSKLSKESNKKDVGRIYKVLVEGTSRRSDEYLYGRNCQNKVVIFKGQKQLIGKEVNVKVYDFTQTSLLAEIIN